MISIIVPVYKVEPYLRQCVDSILGQTYRDIEVLLIDDGSPDRCGEICDEYGRMDHRVRVFHTENRGLSAARNLGLREAQGEYIEFVDSDDWIEKEFCEIPLRAAIANDADLVVFQSIVVSMKISAKKKGLNFGIPTGLIDEFTAHEYGVDAAWNKLYKRELFETIRYPEGRVYEDLATTHKLVHEAKRIFFLNDRLYHYVDRRESITRTRTVSNRRDRFTSSKERYNDLVSWGYPEEKACPSLIGSAIALLSAMSPNEDDEIYRSAKEIVNSAKKVPRSLSHKQKFLLYAWKIDERIFRLLCGALERVDVSANIDKI